MTTFWLVAAVVLGVNILLALVRMALSRTVPERVVALDTINTIVVALLVLLGAAQQKALYVDIAIVYGLLSFVGTLFVAKLMERRR
jgi:multicomponent Na+:H+ antiporter subunit F